MPTTRARRQAQEQSGVPPSPQSVLPATLRRRTRSKKSEKALEASVIKATEHVEDPKSEIQAHLSSPIAHPVLEAVSVSPSIVAPSSSAAAQPVPEVVCTSPTVMTPQLANIGVGRIVHSAPRLPVPAATFDSASRNYSPSAARYPLPAVENIAPLARVPAVPQTRMHLWVDVTSENMSSIEPSNGPSLALTMPSSLVPEIMALIARRPAIMNNKLTHAAVTESFAPSPTKRKLSDDADMPRAAHRLRIEERHGSASSPSSRQRRPLAESNLQSKPFELPSTTKWKRRRMLKQRALYDRNGNMQLSGLDEDHTWENTELAVDKLPHSPSFKENLQANDITSLEGKADEMLRMPELERQEPVEREGESAAIESGAQLVVAARNDPTTPNASRWGFGSLLHSAQTITKYIPLLKLKSTAAAPKVAELVSVVAPPAQPPLSQVMAQTEPRPATQSSVFDSSPASEKVRPARNPRSQKAPLKSALKSKQEVIDKRKQRAEREFMREQADFVRADDARKAREAQDRETMRRRAEAAVTPGGKRKRLPSPDTIPNPPGVSFGMDLDYFCYSSSDEDVEQITPTKQPPSKRARISLPQAMPGPLVGDPLRAQPYTGVLFADPKESYHGGNIFGETASSANAALRAADMVQARASPSPMRETSATAARVAAIGSITGEAHATATDFIANGHSNDAPNLGIPAPPVITPSVTFAVPDPSDSDSDEESEPQDAALTGAVQVPTSAKPTDKWTQPPPPPPTPAHATLPSSGIDDEQLNDAIARARANARKYAPAKSSLLGQSNEVASPSATSKINSNQSLKSVGPTFQHAAQTTGQPDSAINGSEKPPNAFELHEAIKNYAKWKLEVDPVVSQLVDDEWTGQDLKAAEDGLEAELQFAEDGQELELNEPLVADERDLDESTDQALDDYLATDKPDAIDTMDQQSGEFLAVNDPSSDEDMNFLATNEPGSDDALDQALAEYFASEAHSAESTVANHHAERELLSDETQSLQYPILPDNPHEKPGSAFRPDSPAGVSSADMTSDKYLATNPGHLRLYTPEPVELSSAELDASREESLGLRSYISETGDAKMTALDGFGAFDAFLHTTDPNVANMISHVSATKVPDFMAATSEEVMGDGPF